MVVGVPAPDVTTRVCLGVVLDRRTSSALISVRNLVYEFLLERATRDDDGLRLAHGRSSPPTMLTSGNTRSLRLVCGHRSGKDGPVAVSDAVEGMQQLHTLKINDTYATV